MRLVPRLVELRNYDFIFRLAYEIWWAEDMSNQLYCPFGGAVELPCTALKEGNNVWGNMDL